MKAARIHSFGPPDVVVVEDVAVPSPGPGEILILFDAGRITARVGSILPLSEALRAQAMLAGEPHKSGEIVLEIEHSEQHRSAQQGGSTPPHPVHPTVH